MSLFRLDTTARDTSWRLALVMLVYLGLHIWMRLAFSDTLQMDDTEQVVHAQALSLGYGFPQPPLYTWLTWGLFTVFGPSLAALTFLKYAQIAAMFYVAWLLSRHLFTEPAWRAATVLSFLLLPVFAWQMHVGFTHTVTMCLAMIMTLHALFSLAERPAASGYLYLALAIVLGGYAKFGYFLFLVLLFATAMSAPRYRAVLLDRRMLWAGALCLLLAAPYYLWLLERWAWVSGSVGGKFSGAHRLDLGVLAHFRLLLAGLEYALPLLLALLWAFPRAARRIAVPAAEPEQLLARYHLLLFGILLLLMLVKPMEYVKARWMVAILFPLPFWLLLRAHRATPEWRRGLRRYFAVTLVLALLIAAVRLADFVAGERFNSNGRVHLPVMRTLGLLPIDPKGAVFLVDDTFEAAHVALRFSGIPLYTPAAPREFTGTGAPARLILLWTGEAGGKLPAFDRYLADTMNTQSTDYSTTRAGTLRLPGAAYAVHFAEWRQTGAAR